MKYATSIDISNFRGINQTVEPIPLSDLTVVIGRNGTGKSSLLEALYTFIGGQDPISNQPRVNRVIEKHGDGTVGHKYTGNAEITVEIENKEVVSTLSDRVESVRYDGEDHGEVLPKSIFSTNEPRETDIWNLYFAPERSYSDQIGSLSAFTDKIVESGIHVDIAEFLSDHSGTNFTELYLEYDRIRVAPSDGNPYLLDIDDLAHGLLKMVPAYISAEFFNPRYILWDDIDTALHPKLLTQVFEWLAEMESQAIVSTHSMDALLAVLDVTIEDVTVIQLAADSSRNVSFETFSKNKLKQIIGETGHDPRFFPVNDE